MSRSNTPTKDIARMALDGEDAFAAGMLEAVLFYAFDQLCWRQSGASMDALVGCLRAKLEEAA